MTHSIPSGEYESKGCYVAETEHKWERSAQATSGEVFQTPKGALGHHFEEGRDARNKHEACVEDAPNGDPTEEFPWSYRENYRGHGLGEHGGSIHSIIAIVEPNCGVAKGMECSPIQGEAEDIQFRRVEKGNAERRHTIGIPEHKKRLEGITVQLQSTKAIRAKCKRSKQERGKRNQSMLWDHDWNAYENEDSCASFKHRRELKGMSLGQHSSKKSLVGPREDCALKELEFDPLDIASKYEHEHEPMELNVSTIKSKASKEERSCFEEADGGPRWDEYPDEVEDDLALMSDKDKSCERFEECAYGAEGEGLGEPKWDEEVAHVTDSLYELCSDSSDLHIEGAADKHHGCLERDNRVEGPWVHKLPFCNPRGSAREVMK